MTDLSTIAPAFIEMAHCIVLCVAGTTDTTGSPRTRVLHPVWEWNGESMTGWVASAPSSPKAAHLAETPRMSLTYWSTVQDTCTVDCHTSWETAHEERHAGWNRFRDAPEPVAYDPAIIPEWDGPDSPEFGLIRLTPYRVRVTPGSVITSGEGHAMTWHRSS